MPRKSRSGPRTGIVTTDRGSNSGYQAVVIQPDGKIVVGSHYQSPTTGSDFILVRYNTDGSMDDGSPTDSTPGDRFGTGGKVTTDFAGSSDSIVKLLLGTDGKILAVGEAVILQGASNDGDIGLARYNADGTPDLTFGSKGRVTFDMGTINGYRVSELVDDAVLDARGRIVIAGERWWGGDYAQNYLVRCNANGSLDKTFGQNGKVLGPKGSGYNEVWSELLIRQDPAYKIVAVGRNSSYPTVARFNENGSLDTTFGQDLNGDGTRDGMARFGIPRGFNSRSNAAFQPDGRKFIVAASPTNPTNGTADVGLARYNLDDTGASLDTSFDDDGVVITDLSDAFGTPTNEYGYAILHDADGRILVGGQVKFQTAQGSGAEFVVLRYDAQGKLDTDPATGFGQVVDPVTGRRAGFVTTDVRPGFGSSVGPRRGLALYPNTDPAHAGKIVATGWVSDGSLAVVRYWGNDGPGTTGPSTTSLRTVATVGSGGVTSVTRETTMSQSVAATTDPVSSPAAIDAVLEGIEGNHRRWLASRRRRPFHP